MDVDGLLAPVTRERFARDYWGRRVLHVASDSPLRRAIATTAEIDALLHRLGGGDFLTVTTPATGPQPPPGAPRSFEPLAPYRLYAALRTGKSIRLSYAERKLPGAAAAMRAFQAYVRQHPNDATVFISPPGAAAFAHHLDDEHTFTVQLEGVKTWSLHRRGRDGESNPIEDPGPARRRVVLRPGQLLYVPPRVIHRAEASRSLSVSIGFGFRGLTAGDVVRRAADALREELPLGWDAQHAGKIRARLKALDLAEALEELQDVAVRETPALGEGLLGQAPAARYERRAELRVRMSKGRCLVSFPGGGDLRLPASARRSFAWLQASTGPFRLRDVPGPHARTIVSQLAGLGLLAALRD